MKIDSQLEIIFILIGLLIIACAIIILLYRIIKREPFWPSFKKFVRLFLMDFGEWDKLLVGQNPIFMMQMEFL